MKTTLGFATLMALLITSCEQRSTSYTAPAMEQPMAQETPIVSTPQVISTPVAAVPQPSLERVSLAARATLQQYTSQQIAEMASQVASDSGCSANAVQEYYGGSLDYCKAFQFITNAESGKNSAYIDQQNGQIRNDNYDNYQRQSIQTDESLNQGAKVRGLNPGH